MIGVLVGSNVLLDLATADPHWSTWSEVNLATPADTSRLVINAIIYAEISVHYADIGDLDAVLPRAILHREAIPFEAAFLAGKYFFCIAVEAASDAHLYLTSSSAPMRQCPAMSGYRLLTRDAKRYKTYFPKLELIAPD